MDTVCSLPDNECLLCTGNREEIDNVATSWLELLIGMLLYGLPAKAGTRHNIGPMITQCLNQRLPVSSPSSSGHFLTLMEELLPVGPLLILCWT